MSSQVQSLIDYGSGGLIVDIECYLSNNLPNIVIVGFANRAVDEARERVRGAFSSSCLELPRKRITINLAPADIPKASSSFDLAIAAAIMLAAATNATSRTKAIDTDQKHQLTKHDAVMGELGLDGSIRPVRGIIGKIIAGRGQGITTFYIPAANLSQAVMIPGVRLVPISNLAELYGHLFGAKQLPAISSDSEAQAEQNLSASITACAVAVNEDNKLSLSDIIGQQQAKRALEIAAAGGHNLLLSGPPGTGKSMLAKALPSLLPPLTTEEMLEVTHLHSLSSKDYDRIISQRPFRAPHHSASHISVIGGGSVLRPGEISLAHRGILFFDELPEFNRPTIEALRQPLEDRSITISRAGGRFEFPADFILIATSNPCPCGYYETVPTDTAHGHQCQCSPAAIQRYRAKLSGPIIDRIDLYSDVHEVDHANLLRPTGIASRNGNNATDQEVRDRIIAAHLIQSQRFKGPTLNAAMTNRDIRRCAILEADAKGLLDTAGRSLELSARAYLRTVKVARTIADLSGSAEICHAHISEALQYRSRSSVNNL